jgi:steroid delta-isomerase-like uncharacterized protein
MYSMSEHDNIKTAQATWDALNAHDLGKWSQLQAAGYESQAPGAPGPMNQEQTRAYIQGFLTAFPDLHYDVSRTVAKDDNVVMHWTASGSHTGPLATPSGASIPATGKRAVVPGSTTFDIQHGKVQHAWIFFDMASLLIQLGLMPPM